MVINLWQCQDQKIIVMTKTELTLQMLICFNPIRGFIADQNFVHAVREEQKIIKSVAIASVCAFIRPSKYLSIIWMYVTVYKCVCWHLLSFKSPGFRATFPANVLKGQGGQVWRMTSISDLYQEKYFPEGQGKKEWRWSDYGSAGVAHRYIAAGGEQ